MLKNRDIIVFSDDWGRYPSTLQHIVKCLALHNRIIWIGSLALRKPKFHLTDISRIIEKLSSFILPNKHNIKVSNKKEFWILSPIFIPYYDSKVIRLLNTFFLLKTLRKTINKHNFKNFIILSTNPLITDAIRKLKAKSKFYFCVDDYSLFDGAFKFIPKSESDLLNIIDGIFYTSEKLIQYRKLKNGNNWFLPQGVDFNHFNRGKHTTDTQTPLIGFFGLIDSWIDIELIFRAANHYPNYRFVLIGKVKIRVVNVPSNVTFLGEKPYKILPEIASAFNVGLIPFKVNALTEAVNPLKLIEYFSISIPVVSTNLPEVKKFGEVVYTAENDDEFIEHIKRAVEEKQDELKYKRIKIAQSLSWEILAEEVSHKIRNTEK